MSYENERRYLTDDRDSDRRHELLINMGGNGDWYVSVVPEGAYDVARNVRICTSGGAANAAPGLGLAIAAAWRAMGGEQPVQPWVSPEPALCPLRVQSSLEAYVRGLPPGDFVRAVLSNDLNEAIARADDVNIHALAHIVAYVREHLPAVAWGSSEKVNRWLSKAGDSTRPKSTPSLSEGGQL